eukprot:360326_1
MATGNVYMDFMISLFKPHWPMISLSFIIFITWRKHGFKGILFQIFKQLLCVSLIAVVAIFGYVILLKQWKQIENNALTLSVLTDLFYYGNYSKLLNDGSVMIPLSNFLFSAGFLTFILGLLYQNLPIDLIPDIIPLIGLYDNFMASIVSYLGLIVCLIGMILSLRYYEMPIEKVEQENEMNIVTKTVYSAFQFVYNAANNTFG